MRFVPVLAITVVAALVAFAAFTSPSAQETRLDAAGLKKMLEGLGHELKTLDDEEGKEKWEFKVVHSELDIFIGAELSPSKNYIWLTVFFKPGFKDSEASQTLHGLLKGNARIQPAHFFVTANDNLMMALPIENRSVTPAMVRRAIDTLAASVVSTEPLWGNK